MSEPLDPPPSLNEIATPSHPLPSGLILTGILALALIAAIGSLWPQGLPAFAVSALAAALLGLGAVPLLRRLKAGQVIRQEGPQSHLTKAGTPTMGGIFFLPVGLAVALIVTGADLQVLAAAVLTLAYGLIGWLDDWQVIRQQSNKGLTPRQKFLLQVGVAAAFCGWLAWRGSDGSIALPGWGSLSLGWAFWPLAGFVLVGGNNAVNLTDGMDGLAAGVVGILLTGLGLVLVPTDPQLALFAISMSGACLGFLAHNHHPARVFMGDTGSLGLGGAVTAIALLGDCIWALALMGAVLVVEALSVIAQVSYFKYTKRRTGQGQRLLRMSPLHHHLELGGWPETRVVGVLYLISALLAGSGWWLHGFYAVAP